jgi:hypothetical protein
VSFTVLTLSVICATGKVRGDAERKGRTVFEESAPAGAEVVIIAKGAAITARLRRPPSAARVRKERVDMTGYLTLFESRWTKSKCSGRGRAALGAVQELLKPRDYPRRFGRG